MPTSTAYADLCDSIILYSKQRLSPELSLLLRCFRSLEDSKIWEQASEPTPSDISFNIDWSRFIDLCRIHRLVPFVVDQCSFLREHMPAKDWQLLELLNSASRARASRLGHETAKIAQFFSAHHIPALTFKGSALSQLAYGDVKSRTYSDIDLFVRELDIPDAADALDKFNYRLSDDLTHRQMCFLRKYNHALTYNREVDGISIDLHWRFAPKQWPDAIEYSDMWARCEPIVLPHGTTWSLCTEDMLLILCLHGTKEGWTRLQWILDVHKLVHGSRSIDWVKVMSTAQAWHLRRRFLLGLLLSTVFFSTALPIATKKAILNDKTVHDLARDVACNVASHNPIKPELYDLTRLHWKSLDDLVSRLCYAVRTITIPRLKHVDIVIFPTRLGFLYYPLKIMHDYIALPLWILIKKLKALPPSSEN